MREPTDSPSVTNEALQGDLSLPSHLNVRFSFSLNSKLSLSVYHRLKGIAI